MSEERRCTSSWRKTHQYAHVLAGDTLTLLTLRRSMPHFAALMHITGTVEFADAAVTHHLYHRDKRW